MRHVGERRETSRRLFEAAEGPLALSCSSQACGMKLIDLQPRWWGDGDRRRLGITFLCPHCRSVRLGIAFANPPDGGQPHSLQTTSIMWHIHEARTFDVPPGCLWQRTGETFDTLSLTPSVDASKSGHWHGIITNGVVS